MTEVLNVPVKGLAWWEGDNEFVRCPSCGKTAVLDAFDVLGADDGCVFCTQCSQQIDLR